VSIKTHWTTRSCYASLSKEKCSASSQATPTLFKSWRMISFQFFLGLPGPRPVALISQDMARFGILSSFILNTCPSHLSLLCLMIRSKVFNLVCLLIPSLRILSRRVIPSNRRWNLLVCSFHNYNIIIIIINNIFNRIWSLIIPATTQLYKQ